MPTHIFIFLLSTCYAAPAAGMVAWRPREIAAYLTDSANRTSIVLAVVAVVVGTILAGVLVLLVYKSSIDWRAAYGVRRAACGVILTVVGCIGTLWYSTP